MDRVRKVFRPKTGREVVALDDVSLDIADGEFLTIVGPSGCGKSTLLKLVAGLSFPSTGEIRVDDSRVVGPRLGVGMVFQTAVLLKWRTVLSNVLFPVQIMHLDSGKYRVKADDLLQMTGLREFADRYPRELSGGMQQRVSICRALVFDPKILLMDEPFGALDALTREELSIELLQIWQTQQKTVLFVTHNISEAVLLGDRVVVMSPRPGRILEVINVALPRPRSLSITETEKFQSYVSKIRGLIGANASHRDCA